MRDPLTECCLIFEAITLTWFGLESGLGLCLGLGLGLVLG